MDDLACEHRKFSSVTQYATSKLFNVLFSVGLQNLLAQCNIANVKTASLHPGVIDTDIRNGIEEFKEL